MSEGLIQSSALSISLLLEKVFDKLKLFISTYEFHSEADEIEFFKEIKPQIFCKLIYYRKIYNIEMNRPVSGPDSIKAYLNRELDHIQDYNYKRLDFYRYYRSGAFHLDRVYFLRNVSHDIGQYTDSFYFERDPKFSTFGDFRVAKILAGDMLSQYLLNELLEIDSNFFVAQSDTRLIWMDSKTDLCELIFALHAKGSFGPISLTRLATFLQKVFNIEFNTNFSRTFYDMSLRNNPTPYLDSLIDSLLKKVNRTRPKR
ncbi:RteC domain-containing protein [Alistipes sp. An116]|uniref:RteC domain-containing protein n=1 Tax=Alistipes sp. An116 TaxID=1965546 RepID=UPI001EF75080|nr:RteC domain-containing protein [Alistipes sp. An116]